MSRFLLRLVMISIFLLPTAFAQSLFGTLSGTVADPSGRAVAHNGVAIRNENSGDLRKTTTNDDGFFSVPSLPAGSYAVLVDTQGKGFANTEIKGIALSGGDSRSVNVKLTMAQGTQTVEVNAATTTGIVSDTGERTSTITGTQLQSLAIVGRNAAEYLKILPGAMLTNNGGQNGASYSGENYGINGSGVGGNQGGLGGTLLNGQAVDIAMDGAHTFDPGAMGSATPVNPNADMVAEVKVMASNFAAENPQGPVVMNTVTKSGGDQFHGGAYLYARNPIFNANDWKRNHTTPKLERPNSIYYFPGAQISGPVLIPKLGFNKDRNKLFFFDGFEYYKQTVDGGVNRAIVPTLAERMGDFSALTGKSHIDGKSILNKPTSVATDPFWAQANADKTPNLYPFDPLHTHNTALYPVFNNGVLTSAMDPGGKIVLNQYPVPNATPTADTPFNFIQPLSVQQNEWQNVARVDYAFSDNTKIFARYSKQKENQIQPDGLWAGGGSDNSIGAPTPIIGKNASDAVAVSLIHVFSPSMASETSFGYTFIDYPNSPQDPKKLLKSASGYPYKGIFNSTKSMPVFMAWDGAIPSLGNAGFSFNPTMKAVKGITNLGENFSKVYKTHSLKFGAYYETVYNKQDNWGTSEGVFAFGNGNTLSGNVYADILSGWLGGPGGLGYSESVLQPQINIAQKLLDFFAQDSWKVNSRLTLEVGMRFQHMPRAYDKTGYGMAQFNPANYNNDIAQLNNYTGISWHKKDSSIPLSGVNDRLLFYSPRFGAAYDLSGNGTTVLRGGFGLYRRPDSVQSNAYTAPVGTSIGGIGSGCSSNSYADSAPGKPGGTPGKPDSGICNTFAELDYQSTYHGNYNNPLGNGPSGGLIGVSVVDKNVNNQPLTISYSLTLAQTLPKNMIMELGYVGNQGRNGGANINTNFVPLNGIPAISARSADTYRPKTNYTAINEYLSILPSEYDSLQATLNKQQGALNWGLNYTWSKSMAQNDSTPTLPNYGREFFWGATPSNRAHVVNASYTYRIPAIPNTPSLLTRGWQLSGITSLQSGPNLTSNHSVNYGASGNLQSILGTPDWNNFYPKMTCDPRAGLVAHQYINGNCFRLPVRGEMPTGAFPYVAGPAYFNSDLSLFKDVRINEHQNLQLRFEAFNFLNHPLESFSGNDNNLQMTFSSVPNAPLTNALQPGQNCNTNPGGFGCATVKGGRRIIELAAKYSF